MKPTRAKTRSRRRASRRPGDRHRLYVRHAAASDAGAWSVEHDVDWDGIDIEIARSQPDVLDQLRASTLVESFHPVHLGRLLPAIADDVDATTVVALEMYEGFKHFHALRRYLDVVGHTPPITDAELVAIRQSASCQALTPEEVVPRLVRFMLSEHLASHYFRRLAATVREPVLQSLLLMMAADEVRHAQGAFDIIAARLAADRSLVPVVLEAATGFHHFGEEAVGAVPVAESGDPLAIRTFARRIEHLCGVRLVDHLRATLPA
jgi:hypothetical protein